MKPTNVFLVLSCLFLNSCVSIRFSSEKEKKPPQDFLDELQEIRTSWAPDKRTTVFTFEHEFSQDQWIFNLETTEQAVKLPVKNLVDNYFAMGEAQLNFALLPSEDLGNSLYGLIHVSVANLRKSPQHRSELVDQVLLGTKMRLLKKEGGWYLVQTPYQYLGWMTSGSFSRVSADELRLWESADKLQLAVLYTKIYSDTSAHREMIGDAVLGSIFTAGNISGTWQEVYLPDGRSGYIQQQLLRPFLAVRSPSEEAGQAIAEKAREFLGIPYLWGGNSTKGFDCSGFTQTVFRELGYQLPRDASMQVDLGKEVTTQEDYTDLAAGDLIFFGPENRITHVGISLGGSYYIHASSYVRINSLDENDALFNAYRKKRLRAVKRIIK